MRNTVIGLAAAVAIITAGSTVSSSACGRGGSHQGGAHYGYGDRHDGGFASQQYDRSGDRQPPYSRRSGSSD